MAIGIGGSVVTNGVGRSAKFRVVHDRSAILIKARSNVGPITFGTSQLSGEINFASFDGSLTGMREASAKIEIQVAALASGNTLYDTEMHRRIDGRRFPTIGVELASASQMGDGGRFLLAGNMVLHDIAQAISGEVDVELPSSDHLVVEGEHLLDISTFGIELPSTLLLRIYPEVVIEMHLEASLES